MAQLWRPPVTHTRDQRTPTQWLATTQTSRCTSLLSARCPVQHTYIIACCHVITSDYLIGTEGIQIIDRGVSPVGLYVFDGGQCKALREEFIGGPSILLLVVALSRAIGSRAEEWRKKKGFSERGFEEEKGGKGETLSKPYPREKKKNKGKTEKHKNNTRIQESKQSQAVHPYIIVMQWRRRVSKGRKNRTFGYRSRWGVEARKREQRLQRENSKKMNSARMRKEWMKQR